MRADEQTAFEHLQQSVQALHPLASATWTAFATRLTYERLHPGHFLLNIGQVTEAIYFVHRGIIRSFFQRSNGALYSKNLFLAGDWAAVMNSFITQQPSLLGMDVLETTTVLTIPADHFRQLTADFPDFARFYAKFLEQNWVVKDEQNLLAQVTQTAGQRYLQLIQRVPDIEQRLPLFIIASYLGVTPTQLSRLRNRRVSDWAG
ncbi:MAG: Crp/Fnr family transcriptional regulator [Bacteroidota bacterium]